MLQQGVNECWMKVFCAYTVNEFHQKEISGSFERQPRVPVFQAEFGKWPWKGSVMLWLYLFIHTSTNWLIHQQRLFRTFCSKLLLVLPNTERSAHSCSASHDTLQARQKKNLSVHHPLLFIKVDGALMTNSPQCTDNI